MNFTDRTSYLAAVAEWKLAYNAQSELIRSLRTAYHEAQRAYSTSWSDPGHWKAWETMLDAMRALQKARSVATTMVVDRVSGKAEAQRQYLAAKTVC